MLFLLPGLLGGCASKFKPKDAYAMSFLMVIRADDLSWAIVGLIRHMLN